MNIMNTVRWTDTVCLGPRQTGMKLGTGGLTGLGVCFFFCVRLLGMARRLASRATNASLVTEHCV